MDVLVKDGHLGHGKDPKDHVLTAADDVAVAIPRHPLGIKPAGNAYTATQNLKLAAGLFACLPDEVIIQILEELESNSLSKLGGTCKAFYAFTQLEDLWKTLFIEYVVNCEQFSQSPPFPLIYMTTNVVTHRKFKLTAA